MYRWTWQVQSAFYLRAFRGPRALYPACFLPDPGAWIGPLVPLSSQERRVAPPACFLPGPGAWIDPLVPLSSQECRVVSPAYFPPAPGALRDLVQCPTTPPCSTLI